MAGWWQTLIISFAASALGGAIAGVVSGRILLSWQRHKSLLDRDRERLATILGSLSALKKVTSVSQYDDAKEWMRQIEEQVHHIAQPEFLEAKKEICGFLQWRCPRPASARPEGAFIVDDAGVATIGEAARRAWETIEKALARVRY